MTTASPAGVFRIGMFMPCKLGHEVSLPGRKIGMRWRLHKGSLGHWLRRHPENVETKRQARQ